MLLPDDRDVEVDQLVEVYDWPDRQWVRACLVMTLDGALVGPDGLSGSISSRADRAVLSAVRAMSDAYLVGAATVRQEGYGPVTARPELDGPRRAQRQASAPTLAVVSGSCRFDWSVARFQHSDNPPIVLTTERASDEDVDAARSVGCDVQVVGRDRVDLARALEVMAQRGLTRVTMEGGPSLLSQAVAADVLDEFDLTISPAMTGSGAQALGAPAAVSRMDLAHVLAEDGFLFTRYLRTAGT
jgi:riboflavin biosynthesis pyrimidine reductase